MPTIFQDATFLTGPALTTALAQATADALAALPTGITGTGLPDYLTITGSATAGTGPTIQTVSTAANAPLNLLPKGAGLTTLKNVSILSATAGVPTLRMTVAQTFSGAASAPALLSHSSFGGSVSSGQCNLYSFNVDTDAVNSPGGANGLFFGHTIGAGAVGGRTAIFSVLSPSADNPSGSGGGSFMAAGGFFSTFNYWQGGIPGSENGSIFGGNLLATTGSSSAIGSRGYRGVVGSELDFGLAYRALAKHGLSTVEYTGSNGRGTHLEAHFDMCRSILGSAGTDMGILFGSPYGWWPTLPTGTMIDAISDTAAATGPAASAAIGIDFSRVAFSKFFARSNGMAIDGAGNIGGNAVYGASLQTQGAITAKTAVVSAITVIKGGVFTSMPTLTVAPPPLGGTTATAAVGTMGVDYAFSLVGGQGSGYVVGDVLTLSGGTFTAAGKFTVSAVTATGQIIDAEMSTTGSYTVLPASPVTLTGGTGTGANVTPAWKILTVAVTGAGSNYPQFPVPLVTANGNGKTYEPLFDVAMTVTQGTLSLNPGGAVALTPTTPATSAATGAAGQIAVDTNYIYVCSATNVWKRAALTTF